MPRNLSYKEVSKVLAYDPVTGVLTWKVDRGRKTKAGSEAGCLTKVGYRYVGIKVADKTIQFYGHQLAWLLYYKVWPTFELDHKDRNKSNNKIKNIRRATGTQNQANRTSWAKSGLKGVTYRKAGRKWVSRICVGGKQMRLGSFESAEEAAHAYNVAARKHFGEFAVLNKVKVKLSVRARKALFQQIAA